MKIKHIIAVFLLAYLIEALGVHFKIMQLQGAPEIYTAATVLKVMAAALGIWKLLTVKSFKNFLDY
jgi:hypothetical protein